MFRLPMIKAKIYSETGSQSVSLDLNPWIDHVIKNLRVWLYKKSHELSYEPGFWNRFWRSKTQKWANRLGGVLDHRASKRQVTQAITGTLEAFDKYTDAFGAYPNPPDKR